MSEKNPIVDHMFPGDSLNESITIRHDERDPDCGNASHDYSLCVGQVDTADPASPVQSESVIHFQHGARNEPGSTAGVTDAAVLVVLLDRYRGFQSGPFACRENAIVITKLEEALMWMQKRIRDRQIRGVLGKNQK